MTLAPLLYLLALSSSVWLLALALLTCLPRLSAARRSLVWQASLTGVLIGSPLAFIDARLEFPILPAAARVSTTSPALPIEPPAFQEMPAVLTESAPSTTASRFPTWDGSFALWSAYTLGVAISALRLLIGFSILSGVRRRARFVGRVDTDGYLCPTVGQGIPVFTSGEIGVPMAVGIFSPAVLIPEALLTETENLRAILLHESSHARRSDPLFLLLAGITRAIHWFNPLAWVASSRLQIESERAADDDAIRTLGTATDYAECLLQVARRLKSSDPHLFPVSRMAERFEITARLSRILDATVRRSAPSPVTRRLALTCAAALALLVAVVRPVSAEAPPSTPKADNYYTISTFDHVPPPATAAQQIEIAYSLIEVGEKTYTENQDTFEQATKSSSEQSYQKFLKFLNQCKGVDILTAPRATAESGTRATVDIIREFRFPVQFDDSGLPTEFDAKNLGLTIEYVAKLIGEKVVVSGSLRFTEFLGFVHDETKSPSFQTKEAHFYRELKKDEVLIMPIPWQTGTAGLQASTIPPTPTGKRLMLVMKARLPAPSRRLSKSEGEAYLKDLLANFRLQGRPYESASVRDVISRLVPELTDANGQQIAMTWTSIFKGEPPQVSIKTAGMTTEEVLQEIKRQTGLEYILEGTCLTMGTPEEIARRKKLHEANLPYASAVPDKPGFVISPYAPDAGQVDVRGYTPGSPVKCPYSDKMFLVP